MSKPQEKQQLSKPVCADVVDLKNDIPKDIDIYISNTFHQDDNTKISQGQFNVSLKYIYNKYIYPLDLLVHDNKLEYKYKSDGTIKQILDIYIDLCMIYKKCICAYGFECISGIDTDTLNNWLIDKKASREKMEVAKKINQLSQETLKDFLVDGQRNPVGVLAVLNNLHGWSDKRTVITHERQADSLESIANKLGVQRLEST